MAPRGQAWARIPPCTTRVEPGSSRPRGFSRLADRPTTVWDDRGEEIVEAIQEANSSRGFPRQRPGNGELERKAVEEGGGHLARMSCLGDGADDDDSGGTGVQHPGKVRLIDATDSEPRARFPASRCMAD